MAFLIGIDGRYLNDHYPGIGRYVFNLLKALPYVTENDQIINWQSTPIKKPLAIEERGAFVLNVWR